MSDTVLEKIRSYWNTRAEGYSMDNVEELQSEERFVWISKIRSFAPVDKYKKVLDIGCGPGFFSILLALEGYEVTAIDYTDNMLKQAQKNGNEFNVEVTYYQMDAQNLDFNADSFDLIVSRNVMWNLEDPLRAYKEWLRVLRPQGKIFNYDGNYYYALQDIKNPTKAHKHMEGIDVSVIDNIGKSLPLANKLRPKWDMEILKTLGVHEVEACTSEAGPVNFMVYATK